jgi:hypothetical protein
VVVVGGAVVDSAGVTVGRSEALVVEAAAVAGGMVGTNTGGAMGGEMTTGKGIDAGAATAKLGDSTVTIVTIVGSLTADREDGAVGEATTAGVGVGVAVTSAFESPPQPPSKKSAAVNVTSQSLPSIATTSPHFLAVSQHNYTASFRDRVAGPCHVIIVHPKVQDNSIHLPFWIH